MSARPSRQFRFLLEWGGATIGFSEVSGLEADLTAIDYREAGSNYALIKLPGPRKDGMITLERGFAASPNPLYKNGWWHSPIRVTCSPW